MKATPALLPAALTLLAACNPYPTRTGEFSAGPADPAMYPPPYLGTGGDRTKPGKGSVTELRAFVGGAAIGSFSFPFSSSLFSSKPGSTPPDPLRLLDNGMAYPPVPAPKVYVFDPQPPTSAFPAQAQCVPPPNYVYDAFSDEVRYDQQNPIFTVLPSANYAVGQTPTWTYEPIVVEVPVTSKGEDCQGLKSEMSLLASTQVSLLQPNDGHYLAWPQLDPGVAVYRVGQTINNSNGETVQRYGWYNHFLTAYIDGGYIPTATVMVNNNPVLHMTPQHLYYPRSMITQTVNGMPQMVSGNIGLGFDVLDATRADAANYSPVCAVFSYDPGAVSSNMLPTDAATIIQSFGGTLKPASPPYVFCVQVE
jgi:hypothetical protein